MLLLSIANKEDKVYFKMESIDETKYTVPRRKFF